MTPDNKLNSQDEQEDEHEPENSPSSNRPKTPYSPTQQNESDTEDTVEHDQCSECGGRVVEDSKRGERACESCGLVITEDKIDPGPDWRAFNSKEHQEKSRVGSSETFRRHDKGLTTEIGWSNKDSNGRTLNARQRKRATRLRRSNKIIQTNSGSERSCRSANTEIERMASALGLPDGTRELACKTYSTAQQQDLVQGRSIEAVASACLYAATRLAKEGGLARTLDEIAEVGRVPKDNIKNAYQSVNKELGLEIAPPNPKMMIPRFITKINSQVQTINEDRPEDEQYDELTQDVQNLSKRITEAYMEDNKHMSVHPVGPAAAAIYFSARVNNKHIKQQIITAATDITPVTLRERYVEIQAMPEELIHDKRKEYRQ